MSVFPRACTNCIRTNALGNAWIVNGFGTITGGDAIDCGWVLNAVLTIQTNGARYNAARTTRATTGATWPAVRSTNRRWSRALADGLMATALIARSRSTRGSARR